ncbi:MAG: Ig-like domain-containing protein [Maribacter sp.]|nr:Ig-like domain-containing protein [Maribacter sp.]
MLRRIFAFLFLIFIVAALMQCGRRGTPTGGPKDLVPPTLVKAEPENMTLNFKAKKIRLYFDEYIKLEDIQNQLIVSPPLKYTPQITPQGGANKFVEIIIKDTLKPNTTYTFNFGQSIVDNNEGNPASFFTYVFSTGDYIDSLTVAGVIKDAFERKADNFISILLYEIDSTYTDSTLYQRPPNYITNTLDSAVLFTLKNLKAGQYTIFGLKDAAKNNIFDQNADKIAFLRDTVTLPTDSTYVLTLFREVPDYKMSVPSIAAKNKIIFGYYGDGSAVKIQPLTILPDTVKTLVLPERGKDTLNFWFTPFAMDSLVFKTINEQKNSIDTFTVKNRKIALDTLVLKPNQRGALNFYEPFRIEATTPLVRIDTAQMTMINKDSVPILLKATLDTLESQVILDFIREPDQKYNLKILPGAIIDFFGETNDTLSYNLSTKRQEDYGNLSLNIEGNIRYPIIVQLTDEKGVTKIEIKATQPQTFEFNAIDPANYYIRVIFDSNGNGKWDTGNYLQKIQPEKVSYYPGLIEIRPNWEKIETFKVTN